MIVLSAIFKKLVVLLRKRANVVLFIGLFSLALYSLRNVLASILPLLWKLKQERDAYLDS